MIGEVSTRSTKGSAPTFRQLGYALGIAVLGEVCSGGLSRTAGPRLAPSLSGGAAAAVLAKRPGLSHRVHEAFASGLDQTLITAAALGLAGAVAAFTFVRIPRPDATPPTGPAGRSQLRFSRMLFR